MRDERRPMNIRLRELRKSQGKSAQQVALATGISKNGIHILETNPNNSPMIRTLVILADYYGVSLDYLVGRTDNPEIAPKNEDCGTDDNPRPRRRWEKKVVRGEEVPCCPECGRSTGTLYEYDYCPNCGVEMEVDHETD